MNARAVPPDDWSASFRVWPAWYVIVPLIAVLPPALAIDGVIEQLMGRYPAWAKHHSWFWSIAKQPGEYWLSSIATLLILFLHPWRWRAAALIPMAVASSALITALLKWVIGRRRPVTDVSPFDLDPFRGGLSGLFDQRNLCFPSGHATMAFATATILAIILPRYWWVWMSIALLCAIQRVAELAHYPADVIAGAMVGILSARACVGLGLRIVGRSGVSPLPR